MVQSGYITFLFSPSSKLSQSPLSLHQPSRTQERFKPIATQLRSSEAKILGSSDALKLKGEWSSPGQSWMGSVIL